ncbi:ABC transporter ATP-binding protein [Pseudonocardiaceae bacterium YIM PH 21723]|nr:ABC transporter ATP-binding protein [Pseudonocardiaceae bacterium YIM PH 21723]
MAEAPLLSEHPDQTRVLARAWPYLRPHRGAIALALVLSVTSTLAITFLPPVVGWGIDRVQQRDAAGLYLVAGVFAALVIARLFLLRAAEVWLARAGERVVSGLRELAVTRLAAAPLRFLETQRSGELLRRTTSEIAGLTSFIRSDLPDLLGVIGYLIFSIIVLLLYSWQLTLVLVGVFLPLAWATMQWFHRGAKVAFAAEATAQAQMAATFSEGIAARELLSAQGAAGQWRDRVDADGVTLRKALLRTEIVTMRVGGVSLAQCVGYAAILLLGGYLVIHGSLPLSTVAVFVLAMKQIFDSTSELTMLLGRLQNSRTGLARLLDLLDTTEQRDAGPWRAVPERGALTVHRTRYSYVDGVQALTGIDCAFPSGSRTALVGPTGSGKTTLAKLLAGLYAPDAGEIRFADVPLTEIHPERLRERIMLIPQRVHVVTGTLRENLRLVPGLPDDTRIDRALGELGLHDWARGLPDGLETQVSAAGEALSAGERQLIGLIRAALVDPAVLILDEATADIDPLTAERIETAVDRLRADRTLIVIAHRTATIDRLPRSVRLSEGAVEMIVL